MRQGLHINFSEFGVITASGPAKVTTLIEIVHEDEDVRLPQAGRFALSELANQIEWTKKRIRPHTSLGYRPYAPQTINPLLTPVDQAAQMQ
ncbi:MAG TPA: hypothetical protein VKI40_02405 [Terriglobales bacterium]|jgi:hypothetical protein|nr:hypothetical protein [Terriglobales bacterium]